MLSEKVQSKYSRKEDHELAGYSTCVFRRITPEGDSVGGVGEYNQPPLQTNAQVVGEVSKRIIHVVSIKVSAVSALYMAFWVDRP